MLHLLEAGFFQDRTINTLTFVNLGILIKKGKITPILNIPLDNSRYHV